jgi:hypothetical protein
MSCTRVPTFFSVSDQSQRRDQGLFLAEGPKMPTNSGTPVWVVPYSWRKGGPLFVAADTFKRHLNSYFVKCLVVVSGEDADRIFDSLSEGGQPPCGDGTVDCSVVD